MNESEHPEDVDHYGSQYGNFASDLYAEIRAATYDRDIGQNSWLTAAEQDLFLEWLRLESGDRLLDVACGSGGPSLRIVETTDSRIDGIDIHADAVRAARSAAEKRGLDSRATFHQADGSAGLPFEDETFDALSSMASSLPSGTKRKKPIDARIAISSSVKGPVTTIGSVKTSRPPVFSTPGAKRP